MDSRLLKALEMASRLRPTRRANDYIVPSQVGSGQYVVYPEQGDWACTCPDFETTLRECKHVLFVHIWRLREESVPLSPELAARIAKCQARMDAGQVPRERKTFPRDWSTYNQSQAHEKQLFLYLLHQLCQNISHVRPRRRGRPQLPVEDVAFCAILKTYLGVPCRRAIADWQAAYDQQYLSTVPTPPPVWRFLQLATSTPLLDQLLAKSSQPLTAIEDGYAALDSSGFSQDNYACWQDYKSGRIYKKQEWTKVHVICGCRTHIVPAIIIRDKHAADGPQLRELIDAFTARGFHVPHVCADKAYSSQSNLETIAGVGSVPYIPFRIDASGETGGYFGQMYHLWCAHRDECLRHYHQRSHVETLFSVIKRKFGSALRNRKERACANEVIAKFICHNISVLISAMYHFDIDPLLAPSTKPGAARELAANVRLYRQGNA